MERKNITVQTTVNEPIEIVWKKWTTPEDIVKWNNASSEWHTPKAENDVRPGGRFNFRMEARDGSAGFDFWGTYDSVEKNKHIAYTMGDGRKVKVDFMANGNETRVIENFEAEETNSLEMQRAGWQSIMDNFKRYAESRLAA